MSHHKSHHIFLGLVAAVVLVPIVGGSLIYQGASALISGKAVMAHASSLIPKAFLGPSGSTDATSYAVGRLTKAVPGLKALPLPGPHTVPEVPWVAPDSDLVAPPSSPCVPAGTGSASRKWDI